MKPLLIVVSILAVASLGLVYVGQQQPKYSTPPPSQLTNQDNSTDTSSATATLNLVPEKTVLHVGEETTLNVFLTGVENFRISGVHNEFTYDPNKIEVVDITPGDYFENPVELTKVIDPTSHNLTFAVGTLSEDLKQPQTSVFSIQIKALDTTQSLEEIISFNQSTSDVGLIDKNNNQMVVDAQKVILFEESNITIQP